VPDLIAQTFRALKGLGQAAIASDTPETRKPAVSIRQSITDDYLVSLENGQKLRSLKRHLMVQYGMPPQEYRLKWGLPGDYPMVAPAYSARRSELAKGMGLGTERANSSAKKTNADKSNNA